MISTRPTSGGGVDPSEADRESSRRILSSARLKIALTTFVTLLIVVFGTMTLLLVSHIFATLDPPLRQDLRGKAEQGAAHIAAGADFGFVVDDGDVVRKAFGPYETDRDVVAIVATDPSGQPLASVGEVAVPTENLFAGPAAQARSEGNNFVAWAASSVEGRLVGRVAMVVSTERLAAGRRLRNRMMVALAIAGFSGLLLSLSFVTFYVVPLIRVTEQAFERLRLASLDLVAKHRLEKELEIGARIQTCILPKQVEVPGLEFAARMAPATEVGGDYYDVIPVDGGAWIGIGDVAGHGFTSGLVMLMAQSAVAALAQGAGTTSTDVLCRVNDVLYDNIRHRLGQDEHVTMSLLRYFRDGRFVFAGAHEDMIVYRRRTGRCEAVPTPGTWLGAIPDIAHATQDHTLLLEDGDLLVLYTDGVTEARSMDGAMFGTERLIQAVEQCASAPAHAVLDTVFDAVKAWMRVQSDDITLIVLRYRSPSTAS